MNADTILAALDTLTLAELKRVHREAEAMIAHWEANQDPDHNPTAPPKGSSITYQQEYVRCGKATCKKCGPAGQGHGPYWYAYWSEGGRTRKQYLGKRRPAELDQTPAPTPPTTR